MKYFLGSGFESENKYFTSLYYSYFNLSESAMIVASDNKIKVVDYDFITDELRNLMELENIKLNGQLYCKDDNSLFEVESDSVIFFQDGSYNFTVKNKVTRFLGHFVIKVWNKLYICSLHYDNSFVKFVDEESFDVTFYNIDGKVDSGNFVTFRINIINNTVECIHEPVSSLYFIKDLNDVDLSDIKFMHILKNSSSNIKSVVGDYMGKARLAKLLML